MYCVASFTGNCTLLTLGQLRGRAGRLISVLTTLSSFLSSLGLNPKACHTSQSRQKLNINPARSILDGELIWSFLHLPLPEKAEIAKKIGAKVDDIIEELMDLDRMTAHF